MTKDQILETIYKVVDEINQRFPVDKRLEKNPQTNLYGPSGTLDSLGLVVFVIATEQKFQENHNVSVTLADEKAMSQKNSPFQSIESLVNYVELLVKESKKHG